MRVPALPWYLQEKLPERGEAYLQFALLYSTTDGQRRVRVHTLALPITQSLGTAFRGADLDTYMSYVSRKVSSQVRFRPPGPVYMPGEPRGTCHSGSAPWTRAAAGKAPSLPRQQGGCLPPFLCPALFLQQCKPERQMQHFFMLSATHLHHSLRPCPQPHPVPPLPACRSPATPWAHARRPSTRRRQTRCWRTAPTAPPPPPPASSSFPRRSSCCPSTPWRCPRAPCSAPTRAPTRAPPPCGSYSACRCTRRCRSSTRAWWRCTRCWTAQR